MLTIWASPGRRCGGPQRCRARLTQQSWACWHWQARPGEASAFQLSTLLAATLLGLAAESMRGSQTPLYPSRGKEGGVGWGEGRRLPSCSSGIFRWKKLPLHPGRADRGSGAPSCSQRQGQTLGSLHRLDLIGGGPREGNLERRPPPAFLLLWVGVFQAALESLSELDSSTHTFAQKRKQTF